MCTIPDFVTSAGRPQIQIQSARSQFEIGFHALIGMSVVPTLRVVDVGTEFSCAFGWKMAHDDGSKFLKAGLAEGL